MNFKLLAAIGLLGAAYGVSAFGTQAQIDGLAPELKLKAQPESILASEETDQIACSKPHDTDPGECVNVGRMKKYAYVSDEIVPQVNEKGKHEVYEKRTTNSMTFDDGTMRIYLGEPFIQQNGEWHAVDFATTSVEAFDLQATPVMEQVLGIRRVYADNVSVYSGVGDGYAERAPGSVETWATIRSGAGTTADYTTTPIYLRNQRGSGNYNILTRAIFQFNTASIGALSTIASSTLYIHSDSGNTINSGSCGTSAQWLNFYSVTTAGDSSIVAADFNIANHGSAPFTSTTTWATWDADVYQSKQLNAAGVAAINKTGYTKISARTDADAYNVDPSCTNFSYYIYGIDMSETAGTSDDPYLEVQFAPPATSTPLFIRGSTLRIQGGTFINTN